MPNPATITVVGVANSNPYVPDRFISPFEMAVSVRVVSGSVSYTLQYTYDDVPAAAPVNWLNYPTMTTLTAAADVLLNGGPVTAIRLVNAGAGTIEARIVQAGP